MKQVGKIMMALVFCGILTACTSAHHEDDLTENHEQSQAAEEQVEQHRKEDESDRKGTDPDLNELKVSENIQDEEKQEVVLENEAFQIFEPVPHAQVKEQIEIQGRARVFEGTIQFTFEDGHFILRKGFTTASQGEPEWGDFDFIIDLDDVPTGSYRVVLFEESAKDGSILHELIIPVEVN